MVSREIRRFTTTGRVYLEFSDDGTYIEQTFGLPRNATLCFAFDSFIKSWIVGGVKAGEYTFGDLAKAIPVAVSSLAGVYTPEGPPSLQDLSSTQEIPRTTKNFKVTYRLGPPEDKVVGVHPIIDHDAKGRIEAYLKRIMDAPVEFS